jgi:hypothetical protein
MVITLSVGFRTLDLALTRSKEKLTGYPDAIGFYIVDRVARGKVVTTCRRKVGSPPS